MMTNLLLWGHSLQDYRDMFALTDKDLTKKILDCGSGAASFNAELHQRGNSHIISVDELYHLPKEKLSHYLMQCLKTMQQDLVIHQNQLNWIKPNDSLPALVKKCQQGVDLFLADYEQGIQEHRYQFAQSTALPFENFQFDIVLNLYDLFIRHADKSVDFHLSAIKEMARVGKEVRIFPLLDNDGKISPLLGPLLLALQQANYGIELREVPYHLYKNGNTMLLITARECRLAE